MALRNGSSADASLIRRLPKGSIVEILVVMPDANNMFVQVKKLDGVNSIGFVRANYLRPFMEHNNENECVLIQVPLTPTPPVAISNQSAFLAIEWQN